MEELGLVGRFARAVKSRGLASAMKSALQYGKFIFRRRNLDTGKLAVRLKRHSLADAANSRGLEVWLTAEHFDVSDGSRIVRLSNRHLVYARDIVNSFDYYFGAVEPRTSSGIQVVDYSSPRYHDVKGFDLMPVLFPSLSEPIVTANQYLSFADVRPGSTVLDLGAYSGLTSILFRQRAGEEGRVIAVEADPLNVTAIRRNFALYKRISGRSLDLVEGAVWRHCQGLEFSSEGNMGSSAIEFVGSSRGPVRKVESYTLSRLAEMFQLKKVDFIKCDIEGAEAVVFEDEAFFASFRPRIVIEPHIVSGESTIHKCLSDLERFGYHCRAIDQHGVSLPLLECAPE